MRAMLPAGTDDDPLQRALQHCRERGVDPALGLAVAAELENVHADRQLQTAALLSTPEVESAFTLEQLEADYGATTANLVKHVRWLNSFNDTELQTYTDERQAERVRRMVLATVDDARAVVVKLAFRLYRLRQLPHESFEQRRAVSRETLDIYTPLANRLGLGQLKWEMEDLSFRYLEPQAYKTLARALEEKRVQRERYLEGFVQVLDEALGGEGIESYELHARPKHIYSIWKKMRRKQVAFADLFDVRAVRVLVDTVSECYLALGVAHSNWRHIPSEFDDYIANPKDNGYQSLHTAVVGPENKPVEIQIRTRGMHHHAELGVAAHWRYKEGEQADESLQRTVRDLRALLEDGSEETLLDGFQSEVYADRVFVFTPQEQVLDLPSGATPLDFAYEVHTDVGHRCRGAKVNGHIVNLRHKLDNGDRVEILTTGESRPSRDWLNKELGYLVSARARSKVRHWFNQQAHAQHLEEGQAMLERELRRLGFRQFDLERLAAQLRISKASDLHAAIGRNDVTMAQVASAIEALEAPAVVDDALETTGRHRDTGGGVSIEGVGDLLTQMAKCCNPVPFEPLAGYITRGSGVTIHRADCRNLLRLSQTERDRVIDVEWARPDDDPGDRYSVAISVVAHDRKGLLSDIATTVAGDGVDISEAETRIDKRRQQAHVRIRVEVGDYRQLSALLEKISQLRNVIDVRRETS